MSLDVYLIQSAPIARAERIFIREGGATVEIAREEWDTRYPGVEPCVVAPGEDQNVYSANITHNLAEMAKEAGLYEALWRPEEIGITKAAQLILPLQDGLNTLLSDPRRFEQFNPSNGWGDYDALVKFVCAYIVAAARNPDADVDVSR